MLSIAPATFAPAVLFIVACLVSVAMGTSCGTISLIVPIAVAVAEASGYSVAFCVGSVMGGAMFGDNLSFISDTTIAACNTQGCKMRDKFNANFKIALPAAVITFVLIIVLSISSDVGQVEIQQYQLIKLIPYILVLAGGLAGINVFVVLLIGIVSGITIFILHRKPYGKQRTDCGLWSVCISLLLYRCLSACSSAPNSVTEPSETS